MTTQAHDLTVAQAAAQAGKSVTTINRAIAAGTLATVKRGPRRLVPQDSLRVWLRSRNELPAQEAEGA
jgi:excisionase family DNA binding protein